jgi:hypothetical protein
MCRVVVVFLLFPSDPSHTHTPLLVPFASSYFKNLHCVRRSDPIGVQLDVLTRRSLAELNTVFVRDPQAAQRVFDAIQVPAPRVEGEEEEEQDASGSNTHPRQDSADSPPSSSAAGPVWPETGEWLASRGLGDVAARYPARLRSFQVSSGDNVLQFSLCVCSLRLHFFLTPCVCRCMC